MPKGYKRDGTAAFKRLEEGSLQTMFGLRLSQPEAEAVAAYAQHMSITPVQAVRELMKIGLASDPMSAILTAARWTAHDELRQYVSTRFAAMLREISDDVSGMVRGDPNAQIPRGMR